MPRSNIVPLKYSLNQFVTALHYQINLKLEKAAQESATPKSPNSIFFGQYARNPKLMTRNQFGNSQKRSDECFRCGHRPWKPGHRCRPCAIKQNVSRKLHGGTSAVHIISELVQSMETDTENGQDDDTTVNNDDDEIPEAHYFDTMLSDDPNQGIAAAEESYYTHHLESAMNDSNHHAMRTDFRQGDSVSHQDTVAANTRLE